MRKTGLGQGRVRSDLAACWSNLDFRPKAFEIEESLQGYVGVEQLAGYFDLPASRVDPLSTDTISVVET